MAIGLWSKHENLELRRLQVPTEFGSALEATGGPHENHSHYMEDLICTRTHVHAREVAHPLGHALNSMARALSLTFVRARVCVSR